MATYSTGITVTWGGVDFIEVTDVSYSYGGSRSGRDTAWTGDQGSVTVTCLGTANVNISNFGMREQLVITGGGAGLSTYAIWQSVAVAPAMNDVTRYTVNFKIVDN